MCYNFYTKITVVTIIIYKINKHLNTMRLVKVWNENETHYFSKCTKAAAFLGVAQGYLTNYLRGVHDGHMGKLGFSIKYTNDPNVLNKDIE